MKRLTEPQFKALTLLSKHGDMMPSEFAKRMWPDAPGWDRNCKCGPKGTCTGSGMRMAGGAYLGKLRRKGWVGIVWKTYYHEYHLCLEGIRVLKEEQERRSAAADQKAVLPRKKAAKKAWWWFCNNCGLSYTKWSPGEPRAGCPSCGDRGVKHYKGRGTGFEITEPWTPARKK